MSRYIIVVMGRKEVRVYVSIIRVYVSVDKSIYIYIFLIANLRELMCILVLHSWAESNR